MYKIFVYTLGGLLEEDKKQGETGGEQRSVDVTLTYINTHTHTLANLSKQQREANQGRICMTNWPR